MKRGRADHLTPLTDRLALFWERNCDEELSYQDMMVKFGATLEQVQQAMRRLQKSRHMRFRVVTVFSLREE